MTILEQPPPSTQVACVWLTFVEESKYERGFIQVPCERIVLGPGDHASSEFGEQFARVQIKREVLF